MNTTKKQLERKLKCWHNLYYWSSGFVDILEGIVIVLTLGIWKIQWSFRYTSFYARKACEMREEWYKNNENN